jgi:hypothetical protein
MSPGSDPAPLRIERDDAWAELRRDAGDDVVLEMHDPSYHWLVRVGDEVQTVAGAEWWFLAGRLPDDARSIELVAAGERYQACSHAGCWLAALPRDAAIVAEELVPIGSSGQPLETIELGPVVNPPPRPAVPRPELDPQRAPVTLRFDIRQDLTGWIAGVGFFLALALANLALDEPGYALLALLMALLVALACLQPLLPGVYDLRLDGDAFAWRGRLWQARRFRWNDVAHFRPIGQKLSDVGFDLADARRGGWSARVFAEVSGASHSLPGTYGLSAVELAALMNAWRDHHYV